ncbi:MAG: diacylglycerol kinase family protein [Cyanobacteria bacterium J06614_10]
MFSRDSQFSSESKLPHKKPLPRESKLTSTDHRSHSPVTPSENSSLVTGRSQSWQIAPNLFSSFKYAWAGISYAFKTQRNFRVHTGVGTVAMLLCWTLKVSTVEIAVVCLTIGAVLVMEILNTALESLVDLTVGQTYHELAKIAKDCAAGAVLMAAIVALIIAMLIFVPPLWALLAPYLA